MRSAEAGRGNGTASSTRQWPFYSVARLSNASGRVLPCVRKPNDWGYGGSDGMPYMAIMLVYTTG